MLKFVILIFVLFINFGIKVSPQSLADLEKEYNTLKSNIDNNNRILDSLMTILENRANQIENEKQKQKPDKDKIIELMSSSVTLSNKIEGFQEKIEEETENLKQVSKMLQSKYSAKIDSLKTIKKSSSQDLDKTDREILFYTEKRLMISPAVDLLSFNPQKILEIDLKKAKSDSEKSTLKEYLSNALTEVNVLLSEVSKQSEDISSALILQRKTAKFVAESEFDNDFKFDQTSPLSTQNIDEGISFVGGNKLNLDQLNSYGLLLDQLNIFDKSDNLMSSKFSYKSGKTNLSLKDYSELLKEVKQKLNDYKLILANKVANSK